MKVTSLMSQFNKKFKSSFGALLIHTGHLLLIVSFLIFASTAVAQTECNANEKYITVVFRFDDYSERSNTDIEVKIIDAFQRCSVPCTFGVIPYICREGYDSNHEDIAPLGQMKADILNNAIKAGTLDIAQHGYTHQSIVKWGGRSEFAGLSYSCQAEKIAKGKELLERMLGIKINIFVPPWSSCDSNTIRALEELKFECISAQGYGYAQMSSSLKFLPATCNLTQLREAVESARRISSEAQPVIVALFHEYDFIEINKEKGRLTYQEFVDLLNWVTSEDDIKVLSISQAAKVINDLSAGRFLNSRPYYQLYEMMPTFLDRLYHGPVGIYLSSSESCYFRNKLLAFMLVFYLIIMLASMTIFFFAGYNIFPKSKIITWIARYGGPGLLILITVYILRDFIFSYRRVAAVSVCIGACIGMWSSFLKLRKQRCLRKVG